MRTKTWTTATATVVATLALMIPTAAVADPPDQSGAVERAAVLSAWVFWDGDLIVLTGPPQDAATCLGLATQGFDYDGFLKPTSNVVTTPNGAQRISVTHEDRVWVYDDQDTDDPLEWLFGTCAAILGAGEPAPTPLASGEGLVHVTTRIDADGEAVGRTRVAAAVTTADGRQVQLNVVGTDQEGKFPDFINYGG